MRTIVCLGDSLTVGYQSPTLSYPAYHETPYGAVLQTWFNRRASVLIRGVNGELTHDMVERFPQDVTSHAPDCVVILGGTNDLSANIENSDILRNLVQLMEEARSASILPIAVTIPSLRGMGEECELECIRFQVERRRELNHLLKDYCHRSEVPCVDLFSHTIEEASGQLAEEYSNDGIHLSTVGYHLLAQLLWDQVWADDYGARS